MVFDGGKLHSKSDEELTRAEKRQKALLAAQELEREGKTDKAREKYAASIDVCPQMAYELYQYIRTNPLFNGKVEFIVAPYEADAQLAYLNKIGFVDFIISEDSDLLAFGCRRVFFKMDNYGNGEEIDQADFHNCAEMNLKNWNQNMFLYMCIISGCDYLPNINGIGIKAAHRLVNDYRSYHQILQILRQQKRESFPDCYQEMFEKAILTFRFQKVYCPTQNRIVNLHKLLLEDLKLRYKEYPHLPYVDEDEN